VPSVSEDEYEEGYLAHYGILRKSGRYPWGSGQNPHQRSKSFVDIYNDLSKNHGMSDKEIAASFSTKEYPFTTTDLRALKSRTGTIVKQEQIRTAMRLKEAGMSTSAIGREMSVNESTVRSLLEPGRLENLDRVHSVAEMLKRQVEEKELLDVGAQVYRDLPIGENANTRVGVSPDKFNTALSLLKEEGYHVVPVHIKQQGTGEYTKYRILVKPTKKNMTFDEAKRHAFVNRDKIQQITEGRSEDGGHSFKDLETLPPINISSKRVGIVYKEKGGEDADGVIYVRPGVKDISLGKSHYAQVRIAIDNSHYLKGMAIYKDDLPPGVDLLFHTNKSDTGNPHDAMKPFKTIDDKGNIDPTNPFGAAIKIGGQIKDEHGKLTSAMNLINEEGDWNTWSKTLSRQVLSKQEPDLAKSQLDMTYDRRREDFEKIKDLTNPLIRKKLLEEFANETDSAAVHLKAVAMPRQATKVLMPVQSMKPTEIFAPSFEDGQRVALVRYPHAGTFEIPQLTVNNKNREARKLFGLGQGGQAPDAVGIHPKVAAHLSGADFDGDSVVVIPNNRGDIKSSPPLEGLKNFDPKQYAVPKGPKTLQYPDGTPIIDDRRKQQEMGIVTNLIADMTIKGANTQELANAVRHSMVVIDSEKHNLDFKASERDHGIIALRKRYQGVVEKTGGPRGAATLITRATAQKHVVRRKPRPAAEGGPIDPSTGRKMTVPTDEHSIKYKENGKNVTKSFRSKEEADAYIRDHGLVNVVPEPRKFKSKQLAETDNAFSLVSRGVGHPIEQVYAEHSNRLKNLANDARKEFLHTEPLPYSSTAAKTYKEQVDSLNIKLDRALKNAPRERQAQVVAGQIVAQRKRANPNMEKDVEKKLRGQALKQARVRTGAHKDRVEITDDEWKAIQAGAISKTKLEAILKHGDVERIRELATPRVNPVMGASEMARAKSMLASGYTQAQVAAQLGVKVSTLNSSLNPKKKEVK
jgi:DNA-binding CsgD family transcriptional regulator